MLEAEKAQLKALATMSSQLLLHRYRHDVLRQHSVCEMLRALGTCVDCQNDRHLAQNIAHALVVTALYEAPC